MNIPERNNAGSPEFDPPWWVLDQREEQAQTEERESFEEWLARNGDSLVYTSEEIEQLSVQPSLSEEERRAYGPASEATKEPTEEQTDE